MNNVAGVVLTDDVALYNGSETAALVLHFLQVISLHLVIMLLHCVHTDNSLIS